MRSYLFIIVFAYSFSAFAQSVGRVYELHQDLDMLPERTPIAFFQEDNLEVNVFVYRDGNPMPLTSTNLFITWEFMDYQVPGEVLYSFSGSAASPSNGHLRVSLSMSQTDLPVGEYDAYLRASVGQGFDATQYMVVQKHEVSVRDGYP